LTPASFVMVACIISALSNNVVTSFSSVNRSFLTFTTRLARHSSRNENVTTRRIGSSQTFSSMTHSDDAAVTNSTTATSTTTSQTSDFGNASTTTSSDQRIHRAEGIFPVHKPLEWTSHDVVSYIRGMLERDARERGVKLGKRRSRGKNKVKVGHGGTLDPLAEGVLVIGVGKGTKYLQEYLSGAKSYRAGAKLGFETETLDMAGNITKTSDSSTINRVNYESIQRVIDDQFTGGNFHYFSGCVVRHTSFFHINFSLV